MVPDRIAAFAAAAFVLVVVPGPSVLFVIGRGVALGRRAALATVVGNAAGVYLQVVAVAVGLGTLVARSATVFTAVKLVGAAYLVHLGIQAWRHRGRLAVDVLDGPASRSLARSALDGFVVGAANPKVVVFLAAILPQFVDPAAGHVPLQMLLLGLVLVLIALLADGAWALLAGTARAWLSGSPRRLARLGGAGGIVMVLLGLRLATTGRSD